MPRLRFLSPILFAVVCFSFPPPGRAADSSSYVTISRQVAEAEIVRQHRAPNPATARDGNAEANTSVRVFVSASGRVDKVEVVGPPAGRPAGEATAAFIKKSWRFYHPFLVDHHAHAVVFELPLSFLLAATTAFTVSPAASGGMIHMVIYTDARGVGSRVEFLNKVDPQAQESIRNSVVGHFHGVPNYSYRKSVRYNVLKTQS